MENVVVHPVFENVANKNIAAVFDPTYAFRLESLCQNFQVKNLRFTNSNPAVYALLTANVTDTEIVADGKKYTVKDKQDKVLLNDFKQLTVTSAKLVL
jgi:hypothetical protein